jgi:hypothetical protein
MTRSQDATSIPTQEAERALSLAIMERPEGNQWILLAPWGRRYLSAWRAYERGESEKPRLADFTPTVNRDGGTITSTR